MAAPKKKAPGIKPRRVATRDRANDVRIEARVTPDNKLLIESAAELTGQPISQFLVTCALEEAQRVVEQHAGTRLSAANSLLFLDLMENPGPPPQALVDGARRYKERHGL